MARPGITREQVVETAETLVREGQAPTVLAVRKRLGGGSPNTIAPHLAWWKAQREPARADAVPALPEAVDGAMRQVWTAAWQAAQVALEGEREVLATARQEFERERAEILAEIQRLDTALDQARSETRQTAEALNAERRAHEQTRGQVREAVTLAEERHRRILEQGQEVQEARRQIAEASSKAGRLESDLGHAREGLAVAATDAKREAEARAGLACELDQARGDNERLSRDIEVSRETARQAKAAIHDLEGQLEAERQARTEVDRVLLGLQVEAAALRERAAHADGLRELLRKIQPTAKLAAKKKSASPIERDQKGTT